MYSVFLVEDEDIIRDGIKNMINWSDYGFNFIGEASDGELALPLIQKNKPDILITDIEMPFMNGLILSKIVRKELPDTMIIILSSYEDFTYAKEAIDIGVSNYLVKSLSKKQLIEALKEVKEKKDKELEQNKYLKQFNDEMNEHLDSLKRDFLDVLVSGKYSTSEILEKAEFLNLNVFSEFYNILIFLLDEENCNSDNWNNVTNLEERIYSTYLNDESVIIFNTGFGMAVFLIKGRKEEILKNTQKCVKVLNQICEDVNLSDKYSIGVGDFTNRISTIGNSYREARYRLFNKNNFEMDFNIDDVNDKIVNQDSIDKFLSIGLKEETHEFIDDFLKKIGGNAIESFIFRQYILLNVVFSIKSYMTKIGIDEQVIDIDSSFKDATSSVENSKLFLEKIIYKTIELRDYKSDAKYTTILNTALEYINQNYNDSSISLNEIAKITGVSKTYFSSIFSQKLNKTFIEYLTKLRMDKAKELLLSTDKASGEIAFEVGYNDSHYFSFLFKKVNGYSPREYRQKVKDKG